MSVPGPFLFLEASWIPWPVALLRLQVGLHLTDTCPQSHVSSPPSSAPPMKVF